MIVTSCSHPKYFLSDLTNEAANEDMIRRLPKDKKPKEPFWQRITLRSVGKVAAGAIALEAGFLLTSYLTWRFVHCFMNHD